MKLFNFKKNRLEFSNINLYYISTKIIAIDKIQIKMHKILTICNCYISLKFGILFYK